MKMRHLLMLVTVALASCANNQLSTQSETARAEARDAAARLVTVDHGDTLALQRAILDARAIASRYMLDGDSLAVKAFDEEFETYLAEHDMPLHDAIFNE